MFRLSRLTPCQVSSFLERYGQNSSKPREKRGLLTNHGLTAGTCRVEPHAALPILDVDIAVQVSDAPHVREGNDQSR